jgi:hypothetical protein
LYTPLICCPYTFEFERHRCITKQAKQSNEGGLDLVFFFEGDMMILK